MKKITEMLRELISVSPVEGQDPIDFLKPQNLSPREIDQLQAGPKVVVPQKAVIPSDMEPLEAYREITGNYDKAVFDNQREIAEEILISIFENKKILSLLSEKAPTPIKDVLIRFNSSDHESSMLTPNFWQKAVHGLLELFNHTEVMDNIKQLERVHPFFDNCPISLPPHLMLEPIRWSYFAFKNSNPELFSQWSAFMARDSFPKIKRA